MLHLCLWRRTSRSWTRSFTGIHFFQSKISVLFPGILPSFYSPFSFRSVRGHACLMNRSIFFYYYLIFLAETMLMKLLFSSFENPKIVHYKKLNLKVKRWKSHGNNNVKTNNMNVSFFYCSPHIYYNLKKERKGI